MTVNAIERADMAGRRRQRKETQNDRDAAKGADAALARSESLSDPCAPFARTSAALDCRRGSMRQTGVVAGAWASRLSSSRSLGTLSRSLASPPDAAQSSGVSGARPLVVSALEQPNDTPRGSEDLRTRSEASSRSKLRSPSSPRLRCLHALLAVLLHSQLQSRDRHGAHRSRAQGA